MATPDLGDRAPLFDLPGWHDGSEHRFALAEELGHPVVLAFYPGDDTPTCTRQLCAYSDRLDELASVGASVWGISAQDLASHARFAAKRGLRLPLLSDADKSVMRQYGVLGPLGLVRRSVVVVDASGCIAWRHVAPVGLTYRSVEELRGVLSALPT